MNAHDAFKQKVDQLRAGLAETGIVLPPLSFEKSASPGTSAPPSNTFSTESSGFGTPDEPGFPTDEPDSPSIRRRGARPRNLNALKHGFYSKAMDHARRKALKDASISNDLEAEISLLRLRLRDIAAPNANPELFLRTARTLARLVAVQYRIKNFRKYKHLEETSTTNY